ncbi:MAG: ATP-binding protein [Thermodesulfobacteriota bacterium]
MKKTSWFFKRLDLSLRTEVIINISILMLAAIFLIGFTTTKANEKNILQEKTKNAEVIVQDIQTFFEFISRGRRGFSLTNPILKEEVHEFINIYSKGRNFYNLIIIDLEGKVIASHKQEWIDRNFNHILLERSMKSNTREIELEKGNGLWIPDYRKLTISSPLWIRKKMVGGIFIELPMSDMMRRLIEYQRMFLTLIILDSIVLIFFGSFLLSRVLVKPVKELVSLTKKISEGNLNQTIEFSSNNEIGQLIYSFNRMVEQLREKQGKIEKHLESLELTNKKLQEAQEELIRSEKLASIGRFAAGVAHEVGNPLGSILGYTSLLSKEGIDKEEEKEYLKRIEKEIERINRIVRELLDYARPTKFEIKEVEVNQVIENTLSLLSYQKSFKNIETKLDLKPNLSLIRGDDSWLSQVFMNIILNAIDAMPHGGTLRIKTDEFIAGDGISTKFSKGDHLVRIQFSDTGLGIKKEDLKKIFDPFFTTKDPDKGTGLGLSVSLRIVESLGGEIRVESEPEKGSTFEVYFPISQ